MSIPMKREKEVRLREMYRNDYKFITILPAWDTFAYKQAIGSDIDDVLFARCKDLLVDPERYTLSVNAWLSSQIPDLEKVYEALTAEYDPISNYDMIEKEGQISKEGEKVSEAKRYGSERTSKTIPDIRSSRYTTTYDSAVEGRLDAYTVEKVEDGAPTLDGHKAQISESSQLPDTQGKQGTELTEKFSGGVEISAPESELEGDKGYQRELTRSGNIGVTTSQQMLESEIQLRAKYNFINYFCDKFSKEMTIGVWSL